MTRAPTDAEPIPHLDDAEAYVAMICFKHGPPARTGVELEWTVHPRGAPHRVVHAAQLAHALGLHAPPTIAPDSPHAPLPGGSVVTVEPGGQVEISSLPATSLGALVGAVDRDVAALDALLARAGLARGESATDPHRPPRRVLDLPRYAAMQRFVDGYGPHGSVMMCSTAATQVCVDAGTSTEMPRRWHALHSIGPALVALFANSPVVAGRRTGWASNRVRATLGTCPPFTHPVDSRHDPVTTWVDRVMAAPVMCVRRPDGSWFPHRRMSFAAWVAGAGDTRPTFDDLDYHLTTLFPPVRPRGYIEVRYLDTQPAATWHHPLLMLAALLSTPRAVDRALEACEQTADLWRVAARQGLADNRLRRAARHLLELAADRVGLAPAPAPGPTVGARLDPTPGLPSVSPPGHPPDVHRHLPLGTDIPPVLTDEVVTTVHRRLEHADTRSTR